MKAGKVWGETILIKDTPFCRMAYIRVKAGSRCSTHLHQHMTNTRLTDPEILELRYPVRLKRFAIRTDSGGKGRWQGGNGLIRELEFLEPVHLTLLSQHRIEEPYGLAGGKAGKPGKQYITRKSGVVEELIGMTEATLMTGDRFMIFTPGGGGYGPADSTN